MKIGIDNKICFRASYINSENIKKYNPDKNLYEDYRVSFVELNPHDANDLKALDNITKTWENDLFSVNIYNDAYDIYSKKFEKSGIFYGNAFYALTTQQDKFENLDYEKVLGICDVREYDNNASRLLNIQVIPKDIYSFKPEHKGSGSAILTSLKKLYDQIELSARKDKSVRNFYLKNGFFNIGDSLIKFIWKK